MLRRPPRSTRTYTLFPYTTLFRAVSTICRCTSPFDHQLRERASRIAAHPRKGPDYVVHGVLDLIVDHYFTVIQGIGDPVLMMERRLMSDSLDHADIERIFQRLEEGRVGKECVSTCK